MIKAGIVGATGYAGEQLTWILNNHPNVEIEFLCSHSYVGLDYSNIYSNYTGIIQSKCISVSEAQKSLKDIDVLFCAMPSGKSFDIVKKAIQIGIKVIDLGADFRIKDKSTFEKWYGIDHGAPELLNDAVYGLPELYREKIKHAKLLANPGCYPTASILALAPLLSNEIVKKQTIIIDAKSGVSGAGRSASLNSSYCECSESIKAYAVGTHRHTPEIEQVLGSICKGKIILSFTPHLVPMNRGILSTCYADLKKPISEGELVNLYKQFYSNEYFVKVLDKLPETRWVKGSNQCHLGVKVDTRTNRVIVVSAIDNLIKGSAGQAVQNMNIMFELEETTGLKFPAMLP